MTAIDTLPTLDDWAEAIAARLAETIAAAVADTGRALFAGAGGTTPAPIYGRLSTIDLDWSKVTAFHLDEYVGLEPTHDQSYRYFMDSNLFDHINIDKKNTCVAKGVGDVDENLREFQAALAANRDY